MLLQQTNLKVNRQLKSLNYFNSQLSAFLSELHFKQKFSQAINIHLSLIRKIQREKISLSSEIINPSLKLKQIQLRVSHCYQRAPQNTRKNKMSQSQSACKISKHILEIFNSEFQERYTHTIKKLNDIREALYSKIESQLSKQEPYIHEKILSRIKKQAKLYAKQQMIAQMKRVVKQNSKWLSQNKQMADRTANRQQIQSLVLQNINIMKNIMARKIANNDYIHNNFGCRQSKYYKVIQKISSRVNKRLEQQKNRIQQARQARADQELNKQEEKAKIDCEKMVEQLEKMRILLCNDKKIQVIEKDLIERCEVIQRKLNKCYQQ